MPAPDPRWRHCRRLHLVHLSWSSSLQRTQAPTSQSTAQDGFAGRIRRDNVLIERFWRTIKYQEVYLKAYESASDARTNIRRFIDFYNSVRGHSSLQGQTPDSIYFNNTGAAIAA